jgi:aminoglycoside phosphotransferase (APT) family kinase protein
MSKPDFNSEHLSAWLRRNIADLEGAMTITPVTGGQSNPTFFVDFPTRRLVLRKRPSGDILPSAHAVDREYRVQAALAETNVPVPRVLVFQPDTEIIGTPFYVMERLEGRVFADAWLPGVSAVDRRAMILSMVETLAALHAVDWRAVGLEGFGREGNFFQRQVDRWSRQLELSKTRSTPDIDRVTRWLRENLPEDDMTTIVHGDFRLGNMMFHPSEPRVIGVLDWELSTLGHPLADLAYSMLAWKLTPQEYMGFRGVEAPGIPSEAEVLQAYASAAKKPAPLTAFHTVFALFRLAVIFEGIASRAKSGVANAENAADVGRLSATFASRALEAIEARH